VQKKLQTFEEEETGVVPGNSETMLPFKAEQEDGLGTYGLPGGGCQGSVVGTVLRKTMMTFVWAILYVPECA
jgi:hypothetical protein